LPLKGWSRIGVEGATYIYGFNKKELCLKVKYASPVMQNALVNIPQHPLVNIRLPRVNQYFKRDNVSMKVVGYDDGAFVQVAQTSDLSLVKLIDLDVFLSLLSPRRVTIRYNIV
jgi:hypothetical protein